MEDALRHAPQCVTLLLVNILDAVDSGSLVKTGAHFGPRKALQYTARTFGIQDAMLALE